MLGPGDVLRIFLGGYLFWSGLNGFFHWKELPPQNERLRKIIAAFDETQFLMPVIKLIEIGSGAMLAFNWHVPLAIVILAPLIFGIVSLQLVLNFKSGFVVAIWLLVPFISLLIQQWGIFQLLFWE